MDYETTDYMLASLLKSKNIEIKSIEHDQILGRVVFTFNNEKNKASKIAEKHNTTGVNVNSLEFVDALNWAKNRIFSTRRLNQKFI